MKERENQPKYREISKKEFILAIDQLWDRWMGLLEQSQNALKSIQQLANKATAFEQDEDFNVKYLVDENGEMFINIIPKGEMGYGKGKTTK